MAKKKSAPASPMVSTQKMHASQIFEHPVAGWLIAILSISLYFNTLWHQYCLDDVTAVAKNKFVQKAEFAKIFSTEYREGYSENSTGMLYRPLSLAFFAVIWQISPDNPTVFHLFNVLFYGLLVWLLWKTWSNILQKRVPASVVVVAVAMFAVHPVHTEVVANIKSLDEILALLFSTAALHFFYVYHQNGGQKNLFSSLLMWMAALFSKESAITFLPIFPFVLHLFLEKKLADALQKTLPLLLPVAIFLAIRYLVLSKIEQPDGISPLDNVTLGASNISGRFATAFWFVMHYSKALFVPYTLYSDFGAAAATPVQWTDLQAITGFLLSAILLVASILNLKKEFNRWTLPAFGVLFFAITFSVSSNLFLPIGTSYGERLLFMPSWGVCLAASSIIFSWLKHQTHQLILVCFVLVLGSLKTILRNPAWENSLTLCSTDLKTAPESARLNFHYAIEMAKMNEKAIERGTAPDPQRYQTAIEYCNRALQFYPNFYKVKETRGLAYYALGEKDRALPDLLDFLKQEPRNQQLPPKIARIYFERGNSSAAIDVLQQSILAGTRTFDNFLFLGIIFYKNGQLQAALDAFKNAQKIKPDEPSVGQHIKRVETDLKALQTNN